MNLLQILLYIVVLGLSAMIYPQIVVFLCIIINILRPKILLSDAEKNGNYIEFKGLKYFKEK